MEKEKRIWTSIKTDGLTADQRYYRRHKEERNLTGKFSNKAYYQSHKEYWKEFSKIRDKELHLKICKAWRDNNKEKCQLLQKIWRNKNRDIIKVYSNNRRTKTRDLTKKVIQLVYEDNIKKYGTLTCYLCLKPIPFGKDHLEHKIPLSRGGTNEYNNLEVACQTCNCSKHNKTELEYRALKI